MLREGKSGPGNPWIGSFSLSFQVNKKDNIWSTKQKKSGIHTNIVIVQFMEKRKKRRMDTHPKPTPSAKMQEQQFHQFQGNQFTPSSW